jgi:hypothetical protein
VALTSSTPGTKFTLSCAALVSCDYLSVTDSTAAGNTPFYAGSHGTVTTSTGWLATALPLPTPLLANREPRRPHYVVPSRGSF